MDTKDSEKKKTGEREADEDLIAAKWENRMIVRYIDVYKRQAYPSKVTI